jgi:hypothetical protein
MPVDSKHPNFKDIEKDWEQIADCIAGQRVIKAAGTKYLPQPNASDVSEENQERYRAYKKRAVFHNATARTVGNMVGQCFAVDPVPTMPEQMLPWLADIDGAGVSGNQQAKKSLAYVIAFSRACIWVDYPKTAAPVSLADAEEGGIRPKIVLFDPRNVINWRVIPHGAKSKLALVVIREKYIKKDDGFEAEFDWQYRVLRLIDGKYWQEVHRPGNGGFTIIERLQPLGGDGLPLTEIPFVFIGAESNDIEVEKPLMLDISNLNLAHYRNSADYEEITYMVGQPTPWLSGLSDDWVERHLKGSIMLGSRACIPLPEGGAAGLMQCETNTLPKEAMDQKEALMQALGAKLVEKREVKQTATEAGINEASETSILASCCNNVSAAYGLAFRWAAMFGNIETAKPEEEILFELNTDFAIARMTPEEAGAVLTLYQADLITFEEARDKLKTGGWAYLEDEDAKDQIADKADEDFAKAQAELNAQTAAQKELIAAKPAPGVKPGQGGKA